MTEVEMILIEVKPWVDIQKNILEEYPMRVILPPEGKMAVTPVSIISGEAFCLKWAERRG